MPRLAARQYDPLFHLAPRQDHTVCRPPWGSLDGLSSCGVQCERGAKGVRFKMRLSYCPIWTLVLLSIVNSCLASGPDLECAAHSRNSALSQGLFSAEFVRQTWSLPDPHCEIAERAKILSFYIVAICCFHLICGTWSTCLSLWPVQLMVVNLQILSSLSICIFTPCMETGRALQVSHFPPDVM